MIETRPMFLFNPATVEERIAHLPRVAALIHARKRTGQRSTAFPELQQTKREILRVLGRANTYPHLGALLRSLEFCLERGWDAHQLGAQDPDEFASLMSDLALAEHCVLRGLRIESTVGLPIKGPKPDLYLGSSAGRAILEVFRPKELPAFQTFETEVSRLLLEADIGLDYRASLALRGHSDFSPEGKLVSPMHPIDLDKALSIVSDDALRWLAVQLGSVSSGPPVVLVGEWPNVNLKLECEFADVRKSEGNEPARIVSYGESYGGYAPEGMLARLTKPISDKAKKRQAGQPSSDVRVLICDVSGTVVAPHLPEPRRRNSYVSILARELGPSVQRNYDVIALCEHVEWGSKLRAHFIVCASCVYHDLVGELFGITGTLWEATVVAPG